MVFIFGIDVPLIELLAVALGVFVLLLAIVMIELLRIVKKELEILEAEEEIVHKHKKPKEKEHGPSKKIFKGIIKKIHKFRKKLKATKKKPENE